MPEEGYRSITVSDAVYEVLNRLAEDTHRSIPKVIEYLLEKAEKQRGRGAD